MRIAIRKKGKYANGTAKLILERYEGQTLKETRTLPKPDALWKICRPDVKQQNPSSLSEEDKEKQSQKFAYALLTEPSKQDEKKKITDEELKKLWEITK